MKKLSTLFIIVLLFLFAHTCESNDTDDSQIVAGIDLDELFAPPTAAEIQAIENEWQQRTISVDEYNVIMDSTVQIVTSILDLKIVSHRVDGNLHYGAVLVPRTDHSEALPLLTYTHGGDYGLNVDELLQVIGMIGDSINEFIYTAPSFRSEPLNFAGQTWQSEGDPSPWDRDVDDALSLIEAVLQNETQADPERLAVLGFSRGACVGMLMGIREPRIDVIVEFFGPTDFHGEYVREITRNALQGTLEDLPGIDHLNGSFIQPLKSGTLSIADVRPELTRRSPVYFIADLPVLQVHHGTNDQIVNVSQAEALIEAANAAGLTEPQFEYYLYDGGGHNPLTLAGSIPASIEFLLQIANPVVARMCAF